MNLLGGLQSYFLRAIATRMGQTIIMSTALFFQHRFAIYALATLLAGLALAGTARLQTEANYRVYFELSDRLLQLEKDVSRQFGLADSAVLVLDAGQNDLLNSGHLAAFETLERDLQVLPYVGQVSGFYRFVEAQQDVLGDDGRDLFAEPSSDGAQFSSETRWAELLQHPRARDLVSADRRYALVEVQVQLPGENSAREVQQAMAQIKALAQAALVDTGLIAGISFSGALALNHAYIDVVRHDLAVFVPGLLLLIAGVLYAVLRNLRLVALPLLGGLLAALMAMGISGWAGWSLAAINAFAPIIIVSLHLAAGMHLLTAYLLLRARGLSPEVAVDQARVFNRRAMLLSALTTAAGFSLLALSPSPPVRVVGYTVALGVAISYLINTRILPLQLQGLRLEERKIIEIAQRLNTAHLLPWLAANRRPVLMLAALCTALAILGLGRAQINDSVYNYFPEDHGFSRGIEHLDRDFDGCVRLSYVLSQGDRDGALTPEFEQLQQGFTHWLAGQPEVSGGIDIYTLMERAGLDREQGAQLLQERSAADRGLDGLLDANHAATRVELALPALSSRELINFDQRARNWLAANHGLMQFQGGIGPDLIFASLGQRNAYSMFISLGLALVGIGLLVGILFRSASMAALGLACNLAPVLIVYAIWFVAGGYISLGAAVVMGMIMGIVVDDTLHILCKYRQFSLQGVTDPVASIVRDVLPAVILTSVTLIVGLAIGMASDFRPLRELSLLSCGIITAAMLIDVLVLPTFLMGQQRRSD